LAVLDERLRLITLIHLPDLAATLDWLDREAPAPLAIGIDAPQGPRLPLLTDPAIRAAQVPPPPDGRYLRYRVCDYQLARRGIGLYLSPAADEPVPGWMAVGFALFAALRERGFRAPGGPNDTAATLLEVYPYATFVTLLGAVPPSKSTPEGLAIRRRALEEAGVTGLPAAVVRRARALLREYEQNGQATRAARRRIRETAADLQLPLFGDGPGA